MRILTIIMFYLAIQMSWAQSPQMIKDIVEGPTGAFSDDYKILGAENGMIVWSFNQDSLELWYSDGSSIGTGMLLKNAHASRVNGHLMDNDVWILTEVNDTVSIHTFRTDSETFETISTIPGELTASTIFQGDLYLCLKEGFNIQFLKLEDQNGGFELLGEFSGFAGVRFMRANEKRITIMADPKEAMESMALYTYDGQDLNKILVLNSGNESSRQHYPKYVGDKLYFFYNSRNDPYDLWVSDGTLAGTKIIYSELQQESFVNMVEMKGQIEYNDHLLFTSVPIDACSNCNEVYAVDSETDKVTLLDFAPSSSERMYYFAKLGNNLYATYNNGWTSKLQKINPYLIGVINLGDVDSIGYSQSHTVAFNDRLYYSAWFDPMGEELGYYQPGSSVRNMYDLSSGGTSSEPTDLTVSGDKLYFIANDGVHGRELWVLDANTVNTEEFLEGVGDVSINPNPSDGQILINGAQDTEVYIYDVQGRNLGSRQILNARLDISDLDSGTYFLRIEVGSKLEIHRIVKK